MPINDTCTLTTDDITGTDYDWVLFGPFDIYFCEDPGDAFNTRLNPQITLTCKYTDDNYTVYIDSLEVIEEGALELLFGDPLNNPAIDSVNFELGQLASRDMSDNLICGFDKDDIYPVWYNTYAKIAGLIDNHSGFSGKTTSPQLNFHRNLEEPGGDNYNWYGPDGYLWNYSLNEFYDVLATQASDYTPEYQTAYFYPFKEGDEDIQDELDGLIGSYDPVVDTGGGLIYLHQNAKDEGCIPIAHLASFQSRYVEATGGGDGIRFRFPTCGELKAESYLALAYGMKGLAYYHYYSGTNEPQLNVETDKGIGLFHRDDWYTGTYEKTGEETSPGNFENGFNADGYGYCPADALKEFFAELDVLAPCLNNLDLAETNGLVHGGCWSESLGAPSSPRDFIWNISAGTDYYIEATEMQVVNEDSIPPGKYFFLVNRDVEDTNIVCVTLDASAIPEQAPVTNCFLEDMATHALTNGISGSYPGTVQYFVLLEPGCGKLLRFWNDYTWQGRVHIKGEFKVWQDWGSATVSYKTLTIEPGTEINVFNDYDAATGSITPGKIVVPSGEGGLIANGTANAPISFTPKYHSKSEEIVAEKWEGIQFVGSEEDPVNLSNSRLYYCYVLRYIIAIMCSWRLCGVRPGIDFEKEIHRPNHST